MWSTGNVQSSWVSRPVAPAQHGGEQRRVAGQLRKQVPAQPVDQHDQRRGRLRVGANPVRHRPGPVDRRPVQRPSERRPRRAARSRREPGTGPVWPRSQTCASRWLVTRSWRSVLSVSAAKLRAVAAGRTAGPSAARPRRRRPRRAPRCSRRPTPRARRADGSDSVSARPSQTSLRHNTSTRSPSRESTVPQVIRQLSSTLSGCSSVLPCPKKPRPRIHPEHVEAVVAGRLAGQIRREVRPVVARLRADDGEQRVEELAGIQVGADAAAEPIRLDQPVVQRVGDAGQLRQHPQVRPGAGEPRRRACARPRPSRRARWRPTADRNSPARWAHRRSGRTSRRHAGPGRHTVSPSGLPHQLDGVPVHAAEVVVGRARALGDTMHVPIGVSGVHAVPKTLHSHGLSTPLSTSPHWHAFGSATRTPGIANCSSASNSAKSSCSRSALCEMNPSPRHSKCGRSANTSPISASAAGLPCSGTTRVYWFSTSQRPSRIWRSSIVTDGQDVQRLEIRPPPTAFRTPRARTGRAGCPPRSTRGRGRGSPTAAGPAIRGWP